MLAQNKTKIILLIIAVAVVVFAFVHENNHAESGSFPLSFWPVRSIDTSKYSRDQARQQATNAAFDQVIDQQVAEIAKSGANYVAINTPYDREFVPFLTRWVQAARRHGLSVWFRGNFSGWERWFNYPPISRDQHLAMSENFIISNPDLFQSGDIFSACPECENGGPGDPRQTGDVAGFRQFLIDENNGITKAFAQIKKHVITNYDSMNLDVANLVMDKATTAALGGVITVDHYAQTPEKFDLNLQALAKNTGAKIVVGEFGAPIPDLNGTLTPDQQKTFVSAELDALAKNPNVIGVNYWVSVGGSTELWGDDGTPTPAVDAISAYYQPKLISGFVTDALSRPIIGAHIVSAYHTVQTDAYGRYTIPVIAGMTLQISADGYQSVSTTAQDNLQSVLTLNQESFWFKLLKKFKH